MLFIYDFTVIGWIYTFKLLTVLIAFWLNWVYTFMSHAQTRLCMLIYKTKLCLSIFGSDVHAICANWLVHANLCK